MEEFAAGDVVYLDEDKNPAVAADTRLVPNFAYTVGAVIENRMSSSDHPQIVFLQGEYNQYSYLPEEDFPDPEGKKRIPFSGKWFKKMSPKK